MPKNAKTNRASAAYLRDALLILSLLLIGAAAFLLIRLTAKDGRYVTVEVGDEPPITVSLDTPAEIPLAGGGNTLVIENGKAYVRDCTCPDKLCEKQGKISKSGESITCLPNHVHIRVDGDGGVDVGQ